MAVDTIDFARKLTLLSQLVTQPAAGADFTITVPAGQIWRVFCMSAQLVTSSTVATRVPQLFIKDAAGNIIFEQSPTSGQAASITGQWSWLPGVNSSLNNSIAVSQFPPDLILPEGFVIASSTANIQTGDQWSKVAIMIGVGAAL